jgi:ElaB/YqjD/DUF883 family membrane-anchored ribosome-binding protein
MGGSMGGSMGMGGFGAGPEGGADASRRMRDDLDNLKADFSVLRDDFKSFMSSAASAARTGAGVAKDRVGETTSRLREHSSKAFGAAKEKGVAARDTVGEQIEEHPFAAVGIAFGVGLVLGAVLSRR